LPKIKNVFGLIILIILIFPLALRSQGCEKVKISDFPIKDQPTENDKLKLKDEEPYIYYYGIGVKIDYVKARHLALIDLEKNVRGKSVIDGYSILMMLYANGFGVDRNLDLSIRLACGNVGGAPAELEGRVQHLKNLKGGDSTEIFDVCDDITSGFMDGICHSIQSEIMAVNRKQDLDSIISKWSVQERQSYRMLRKAADSFFDKRVVFEVDLTGTSRAAFQQDESDELEDGFLSKLRKADKCSIKKYPQNDFLESDGKLNKVYSKIKDNTISIYGSVTKEGVKKTEIKWIQYRDAWVTFASIKCPLIPGIWWKTMITNERIEELQNLVDNQY
jgi:hypothetical protein